MKNIHPEIKSCLFTCATCGSKFDIKTTMKNDSYSIDICSKCHPFYVGKANVSQLRGRSEKMSSKFEAGKSFNEASKKQVKEPKVKKSTRETKGLDSL